MTGSVELGSWSIKLDPGTTVLEAAALMHRFDCRCLVTADFEVVLVPRHRQLCPPSGLELAVLLIYGLAPAMVMVSPKGMTFEQWLNA